MTNYHILSGMKEIKTIHELVDFFGGDTAMADFFGTTQSVVGQWKCRNAIAAGWHLRIFAEASRRGVKVHPSIFGLDEYPPGLLPDVQSSKKRVEERA
jgi:hypothetical protein